MLAPSHIRVRAGNAPEGAVSGRSLPPERWLTGRIRPSFASDEYVRHGFASHFRASQGKESPQSM